MAQAAARPLLRRWPRWHQHCCSRATSNLFLSSPPLLSANSKTPFRHLHSTISLLSTRRNAGSRSRGLELAEDPEPSDTSESYSGDSESDVEVEKSRNEKKRFAKQTWNFGLQLATFPDSTIRTILRTVSVDREEDVFEALMLAKKLLQREESRVREGRRRLFNLIGKMLRDAEPDLLHDLILATRLGDKARFQELTASSGALIVEDNYEDDDEEPCDYIHTATRWFEGLMTKDNDITKEVYSITSVEFDRQELRKLVREVHSIQARRFDVEENRRQVEASLMHAKRSLTRFLRAIAKQIPTE